MLTCADLLGLQNRRWRVHLLPMHKYVPLLLARHCMSCLPILHSPFKLNMLCHMLHAVVQMKERFTCPRCKIRYVRQTAKLAFPCATTYTIWCISSLMPHRMDQCPRQSHTHTAVTLVEHVRCRNVIKNISSYGCTPWAQTYSSHLLSAQSSRLQTLTW